VTTTRAVFSLYATTTAHLAKCNRISILCKEQTKQTPWSESASELYRPSDRRLLAKLVQIFADRGCHVVSATDPYGRILEFLDRHIKSTNMK
jgi:hypothetical protein